MASFLTVPAGYDRPARGVNSNRGGGGKPPFRDRLDYIDRQITLVGTGGLLTMLSESGAGTLAGA